MNMNAIHRRYCASERWRRTVHESVLPGVLDGLELGDDVLEIGPGPGLTTEVLAGRTARLTALELEPELARTVAARVPSAEVVTGDATAMPSPDDRFSAALSFTMLHHIPTARARTACSRRSGGCCAPAACSRAPTRPAGGCSSA